MADIRPEIHKELVEGFVDSLRVQRRAKSTLDTYYRALWHIMNWPGWELRSADDKTTKKGEAVTGSTTCSLLFSPYSFKHDVLHPKDLTRADAALLSEWIRALRTPQGRNITPGTQAMIIRVLKQFFQWLVAENHIIASPVEYLVLPGKTRLRKQPLLTVEEVKSLLEAPEPWTSIGLRDRAIIEMFYSAGMRRLELATLQITDVDTATGHVRIRKGKGNRERVVPLGAKAVQALERYLRQARPLLSGKTGKHKCNALFVTLGGKPLTVNNLAQMLKKRGEQAGTGRVSAHMLRRSCATHMCNAGMPLPAIQQILGHSELKTTREYLKLGIYEARETHNAKHPRERLQIAHDIHRTHRRGIAAPAGYTGTMEPAGH